MNGATPAGPSTSTTTRNAPNNPAWTTGGQPGEVGEHVAGEGAGQELHGQGGGDGQDSTNGVTSGAVPQAVRMRQQDVEGGAHRVGAEEDPADADEVERDEAARASAAGVPSTAARRSARPRRARRTGRPIPSSGPPCPPGPAAPVGNPTGGHALAEADQGHLTPPAAWPGSTPGSRRGVARPPARRPGRPPR